MPEIPTHTLQVLSDVAKERHRQEQKWGPQNHDPATWLAILGEEFGEVAKEVAETTLRPLNPGAYRAELVQVAAVAVAAILCLEHNTTAGPDGELDGNPPPPPPAGTCTRPPAGWTCTRFPGHDGPCAAIRIPTAAHLHACTVCGRSSWEPLPVDAAGCHQDHDGESCGGRIHVGLAWKDPADA